MDKYIGFDIDSKKVSVCVVESGKQDYYAKISPDIVLWLPCGINFAAVPMASLHTGCP
jgi:hypothetical protein